MPVLEHSKIRRHLALSSSMNLKKFCCTSSCRNCFVPFRRFGLRRETESSTSFALRLFQRSDRGDFAHLRHHPKPEDYVRPRRAKRDAMKQTIFEHFLVPDEDDRRRCMKRSDRVFMSCYSFSNVGILLLLYILIYLVAPMQTMDRSLPTSMAAGTGSCRRRRQNILSPAISSKGSWTTLPSMSEQWVKMLLCPCRLCVSNHLEGTAYSLQSTRPA